MTRVGDGNSEFWIATYVIALVVAGLIAWLMARYLPFKYHWVAATILIVFAVAIVFIAFNMGY